MRLKNYLLIEGKAVRVGVDMTRVFLSLAGKRVPWFSLIHQDEVRSSSDIERVYLSYAYYDLDGKMDMTQHAQVANQLIDKWFERIFPILDTKPEEKNVLPIRHVVKKPKLTNPELLTLQAKVSKDLGIPVSINLLLHTVS